MSASNDLSIRLWDLQANDSLFEAASAHTDSIREALFADKEEKTLISGGYDRMLKLWDVRQSDPLVATKELDQPLEALCVGETSDQIISAYGNSCSVWDLRMLLANGPTITLKPHWKTILTLAYDHNRKRIITGSADSLLKFSDPLVR